jgi:pimeloyl-ACP methyl ester carboxylesterase
MEKNLTISQIFSARSQYIPLVEKQLRKKRDMMLEAYGKSGPVSYRKIHIPELCIYDRIPIIPLTGWGSGWEGIAPLAFSLACEGHMVFPVSLPGYGDSENPPRGYYGRNNFILLAAYTIADLLERLDIEEAVVIGHSMGAEIMTKLANALPHVVKKLVLLNPSGIDRYGFFSRFGLIWRFCKSGMALRNEYQKLLNASAEEDYIQPMIDWCSRQNNPFGWGRLNQRWAEFLSICEGMLLESIRYVSVPTAFISGELDTVFPAWASERVLRDAATLAPSFESSILAGVGHNPTLYHSEITAAAIAHLLEG